LDRKHRDDQSPGDSTWFCAIGNCDSFLHHRDIEFGTVLSSLSPAFTNMGGQGFTLMVNGASSRRGPLFHGERRRSQLNLSAEISLWRWCLHRMSRQGERAQSHVQTPVPGGANSGFRSCSLLVLLVIVFVGALAPDTIWHRPGGES
jgi:hypothetical protein